MIKTLLGMKINDLFVNDGNIFKVVSFPSRNMVFGKLVHELTKPAPYCIKTSRRNVNTDFNNMIKEYVLQ